MSRPIIANSSDTLKIDKSFSNNSYSLQLLQSKSRLVIENIYFTLFTSSKSSLDI